MNFILNVLSFYSLRKPNSILLSKRISIKLKIYGVILLDNHLVNMFEKYKTNKKGGSYQGIEILQKHSNYRFL